MTDSIKAIRFPAFKALICMILLLVACAGYLILDCRISIVHVPKQPFELISSESDMPSLGPFQLGQIMQLNYPITFRDYARNIYGDPIRSHIEDNKYHRYDNAYFATKSFLTESYKFDVGVLANIHVETLASGEILYVEYNYKFTDARNCNNLHSKFKRTLANRYDSLWLSELDTGVLFKSDNSSYIEPIPDTFIALSKSCGVGDNGGNSVLVVLSLKADAIMSKLLVSPLPQHNEG